MCSRHQPEVLAAARARPIDPETGTTLPCTDRATKAAAKKRLSSRKRMVNPFAIQHRTPIAPPPSCMMFARGFRSAVESYVRKTVLLKTVLSKAWQGM